MQPRSRSLSSKIWLTRLAAAAVVLSSTFSAAWAGERCVDVGEVHSAVARRGVDMTTLLRQTVESEVAKIDPARTVGKRRAIVSVSLLQMGPSATNTALDTCRVVATVRDAHKGALLATLEGDAKMSHEKGQSPNALSTDLTMMRSAVQGFVKRLPEALTE